MDAVFWPLRKMCKNQTGSDVIIPQLFVLKTCSQSDSKPLYSLCATRGQQRSDWNIQVLQVKLSRVPASLTRAHAHIK